MFQTRATSGDGEHHFRLDGFTIDGQNRVEGLKVRGFLYTVKDLEIKNCDGHGFVSSSFLGEPEGPFVENGAIIENLDAIFCGNSTKEPMVFDGPEGAREEHVYIMGANPGCVISGRVQGFPDFAPGAQGIKISGPTNSGHLIEVQLINCPGGGIIFEQGAAAYSMIRMSSWNAPLVGTPHETTLLTHTGGG